MITIPTFLLPLVKNIKSQTEEKIHFDNENDEESEEERYEDVQENG